MVISNLKFFIGGGGAFWSEIPERDFLENLDKNLLSEVNCTKIYCLRSTVQKPAYASQIVSHILRMWRLITTLGNLMPMCEYSRFCKTLYLCHLWILSVNSYLKPQAEGYIVTKLIQREGKLNIS